MTQEQLMLIAQSNPEIPHTFLVWLGDNWHVWQAFVEETFAVIESGHRRYSARTVVEYIRHKTHVKENSGSGFKLNNNHTPYLGRLFAMIYPEYADIFSFRAVGC
jgi:hypothetical protein